MFQRKSDGLFVERVNIDGHTKQVTAKTRAALIKKLTEINSRQENGRTFAEVADAWERYKGERIAYNTLQAYRPHIKRAVEYFGEDYIKDITPAEIQAYIDTLAAQLMAKDTVHRALVICSEIFDFAIVSKGSLIRYNPCAAVKIPKGLAKSRRQPPTSAQINAIAPDSEMGLFTYFLLYTGLRRGELLALKWEDIDRHEKLIHVRRACYFENGKPKLKDTKTESSRRDVELLDILEQALPKGGAGYVFGGAEMWTAYEFNRKWLEFCKGLGFVERMEYKHTAANKHTYTQVKYKAAITPHQFRHEYASMLEDAGIRDFAAMQALGHSSITVTKDTYTHIRQAKEARIGEQLNEYIENKKAGN